MKSRTILLAGALVDGGVFDILNSTLYILARNLGAGSLAVEVSTDTAPPYTNFIPYDPGTGALILTALSPDATITDDGFYRIVPTAAPVDSYATVESYSNFMLPFFTPYDGDLVAIAALTGTGFAERTAPETWALTSVVRTSEKGVANGVATLDSGGKVPVAQLPPITITETFVVGSQAAMLALVAQTGDVAVRTDLSKSFILTAEPATVLGNWQELLTPALPADLAALAAFGAGTGIAARTGVGTWALRTLIAGLGIAIADPGGVAAAPTITIDPAYVGQASITTVGAITAGTWNAGQVTSSGTVQGTQLISTVAVGTAPLSVTSTTVVPNLNVSQLLGLTWTSPGTIGSVAPSTGVFTTLSVASGAFGLGSVFSVGQARAVVAGADAVSYLTRNDVPLANSASSNYAVWVESQFTGGTTITQATEGGVYARVRSEGAGTGGITTVASYTSEFIQAAGNRTAASVFGYFAAASTVTVGTVTTYFGFGVADQASANITNVRAFRGAVVTGTGRYNAYMDGSAPNYFSGLVGIGNVSITPAALLDVGNNISAASWTTNGIGLRLRGTTFTDSSTGAAGTAVTNHIHAIAASAIAATNAGVTTTTAATLYIAGAPTNGANMTITTPLAFQVAAGQSMFPVGAAGTPAIAFGAATQGLFFGTNGVTAYHGSASRVSLGSGGAVLANTAALGWTSTTDSNGTIDLSLFRDGANTLAQRNGTTAQFFRIYNTYTDASNYERLDLSWGSNIANVSASAAGTGTRRTLALAGQTITFAAAGSSVWSMGSAANTAFLPANNNVWDIGSTSFVVRNGFFGTSIVLAGPAGFVNGITLSSAATGNPATIAAVGSDANFGLTISSKGNGALKLDPATGDVQWGKALVALGGGAAPTVGTIGGTGPATAAQNSWLRLLDSTGAACWVPVWK